MAKKRRLFDAVQGSHGLVFAAAFHIGIPLSLLATKRETDWRAIRDGVLGELTSAKRSSITPREPIEFNTESRFPAGDPVALRYCEFEERFALGKLMAGDAGLDKLAAAISTDNTILICPSGLLLIIGQYTASSREAFRRVGLDLKSFGDLIEQHYQDLREVFCDIMEALGPILDRRVTKLRRAFFGGPDIHALRNTVEDDLGQADPLLDVYYMECEAGSAAPDEGLDEAVITVGYVDAHLRSSDLVYAELILFIYSSFAGFKWTVGFLNSKAQEIQNSLAASRRLPNRLDDEIKLLRIFCFAFINESRPIMIRLTECYLKPLESFWEKSRMEDLASRMVQQVENLDRMVEWAQQVRRESTNIWIGTAAVILSVISLGAAVAGVVSTVDAPQVWARALRWQIIGFASIVCVVLALVLASLMPKFVRALGSRRGTRSQAAGDRRSRTSR